MVSVEFNRLSNIKKLEHFKSIQVLKDIDGDGAQEKIMVVQQDILTWVQDTSIGYH
jgi:hypothetical protein